MRSPSPRKPHATLAALLLLAGSALAAPQPFEVVTVDCNYAPIVGTTIWSGSPVVHDDESADIALGFEFPFMGILYDTIRVSTNGYITFAPGNGILHINSLLPDATLTQPMLAPWWDDLKVAAYGTTDTVSYQLSGAVGQREMIVQWSSVSRFSDTAVNHHFLNFQVHLFESSGVIEFHYGNSGIAGAPPTDFTASCALQDDSAAFGINPIDIRADLSTADHPPAGRMFRFIPGYELSVSNSIYAPLGAGATVLADGSVSPRDDTFFDVPVGFTFPYYGTRQDTLRVSVNGFATFGASGGVFANDYLPDPTSAVLPILAPWWDDLYAGNFGSASRLLYQVTGAVGARQLTVEWSAMMQFNDTQTDYRHLSFQLVLVESTGMIQFRYGSMTSVGAPLQPSASVGISNGDGNRGIAPLPGNPSLAAVDFPAIGKVFTFTPVPFSVLRLNVAYNSVYPGGTRIWDGVLTPTDDSFQDIAIGFTFRYMGIDYSTLRVSSNGYVTFPNGDGDEFDNLALPTGTAVGAIIAPWWDDLKVNAYGTTDEVSYQLTGAVGSRELTVEWHSVSHFGETAANYSFLYFQVHLYEGSNQVEMAYGLSGFSGAPGALTASVGFQDPTGRVGASLLCNSPNLSLAVMPGNGALIELTPDTAPLLCGDCNTDQGVNIIDALLAAQHSLGIVTLSGSRFASCNTSGIPGGTTTPGAVVSILDALAIAQKAVSLTAGLSCSN